MKRLVTVLITAISLYSFGQDSLKHEKKFYVGTDGKLYWNRYLPFYLTISPTSNPNDGLQLKSETTPQYVNPAYFDSEGIHQIKHSFAVNPQTKQVVKPELDVMWEVHADGTPPITKNHFILATRYQDSGNLIFGPGLAMTLTATDQLSGVAKTYYSINRAKWTEYKDTLWFKNEGVYNVQYYSVDNVGNAENYHTANFTVDITPPESNYTITGISLEGNVISSRTLVSLTSMDKISGVSKTFYQIDGGAPVLYRGGNLPISSLVDGPHTLIYWSIDNVGNEEKKQVFEFYLDNIAPILTGDVLGDRYIVGNQVYFSGRTKMKLTAVDNKSGIKEVMYSINGEDFKTYEQPFYLPTVQGHHVVRYFAIDNLGNNSQLAGKVNFQLDSYKYNINKVYVDLVGPTLNFNFVGDVFKARDTTFINSKTKIVLSGKDNESGLQYLSYSINDTLEETRYTNAFSVTKSGYNKVEYFGYDNVNNRNKGFFDFIVDNEPPVLFHNFSILPIGTKDGLNVYPSYVVLYLAASDDKVGTKDIYYSLNGAPEKVFTKFIDGFLPRKLNILKIRALDKLNNESTQELKFWIE